MILPDGQGHLRSGVRAKGEAHAYTRPEWLPQWESGADQRHPAPPQPNTMIHNAERNPKRSLKLRRWIQVKGVTDGLP
jgi:hypothetical protein